MDSILEKLPLELLLDLIPMRLWIKDKDGKFLFANKKLCDEVGLCKEDIINKYNKDIFSEEIRVAYDNNYDKLNSSDKPVKDIRPTANKMQEAYITKFEVGDNEYILGIAYDVTERVKYENELLEQKNIFKGIIDNLPDVIFYKDLDSRYRVCNATMKNNLNKKEEDIIGKTDGELHAASGRITEKFVEDDKYIIRTKKSMKSEAKLIINGEETIWEANKIPLLDNNEVCGIVGITRDITSQRKLENKLRELSYKDALTGLYNRTFFDETISTFDTDECLPFSIIMGDVNGLKIINDTLGHLEGDKYLISITHNIKKICNTEYIFRWGGDEIVILLPKTTLSQCDDLCKIITSELNKKSYGHMPLSISLGSATTNTINKSVDLLLKEAEDKVYRKKLLENNSTRSDIIYSLQKSLEEKSMETKQHTQRLIDNALRIGRRLGLNESELDEVVLVATLHDIGKIGIPEEILMKPGKLTDEEFQIMKTHSEKGFRIAQTSSDLTHIARGILTHHERWDGSGYPLNLAGEDIPLSARIIAVVDSFDAMTNERVYKKEIPIKEAIDEIRRCSGKQFDPRIVGVFLDEMKEIK